MLRIFITLFLLVFLMPGKCFSATIDTCVNTGVINSLKTFDTWWLTLGQNIPDFTILSSMNNYVISQSNGKCGASVVNVALTVPTSPYGAPHSYGGYIIYPTSESGLGISFTNRSGINQNQPVPLYPAMLTKTTNTSGGGSEAMTLDVKLWKIPGQMVTSKTITTLTSPVVAQGMVALPGDTFGPSIEQSRLVGDDFYTTNSNYIYTDKKSGTSPLIWSGTCDISSDYTTVDLGQFEGSPSRRTSDWKNANFTISGCPDASGYGTVFTNGTRTTINNIKNTTLNMKVLARTSEVTRDYLGNPLKGVIALNGAGAQGYGIQLAWGAIGAQSSNPPSPVVFDEKIPLSKYSSNYAPNSSGNSYTIGYKPGAAILIEMSARFIRTGADIAAGPASSFVEVIASYD